jgi:uncharacterized protein (UPF0335 family)
MTDAKLKSLVERIERLMDERDGLGEDIRDVFTEVKSAGYVPKVLRKVIVRRRMDPSKRAEEDSWQEMYEAALDGPTRKALTMAASGATARQIEAETGIDQATVARSVSLKKRRETATPHDPETGEVTEAASIGDDAGHRSEPSTPAEQSVNSVPSSVPARAPSNDGEGEQSGTHSEEQGDRQSPLRGGTGTAVTSCPAPAAATISPGVPDDLQIPAHLDRRVRA